MHHRTNIAFIDSHAVRARGGEDRIRSIKELLLDGLFPSSLEAGVVKQGGAGREVFREQTGDRLRFRARATEYQRRALDVPAGMPHRQG